MLAPMSASNGASRALLVAKQENREKMRELNRDERMRKARAKLRKGLLFVTRTKGISKETEQFRKLKDWAGLASEEAPPYSIQYWDERYVSASGLAGKKGSNSASAAHDWYLPFSRVKRIILPRLPVPEHRAEILYIGCGTSEFPAELAKHRYRNVTCVDTSSVCIDQMTRAVSSGHFGGGMDQSGGGGIDQSGAAHSIEYLQMDAAELDFPDMQFDCVLDKAMLDMVIATEPNPQAKVKRIIREVIRVLNPGGFFVCVSHGTPDERLDYITLNRTAPWKVEVIKLVKPTVSFVCRNGLEILLWEERFGISARACLESRGRASPEPAPILAPFYRGPRPAE